MELNGSLVKEINDLGGEAFGLSGKENNMIRTVQKKAQEDLGYVGSVSAIDTTILKRLIDTNIIPVISPVGKGEDNKVYNINADDAASNIAIALGAEKLVLMTNIMGVMEDEKDPSTLFHSLTLSKVNDLIFKGVIKEGMLPKVNAALHAIEGGIKKAHIVETSLKHALLLEIFTDTGIGTEIVK